MKHAKIRFFSLRKSTLLRYSKFLQLPTDELLKTTQFANSHFVHAETFDKTENAGLLDTVTFRHRKTGFAYTSLNYDYIIRKKKQKKKLNQLLSFLQVVPVSETKLKN